MQGIYDPMGVYIYMLLLYYYEGKVRRKIDNFSSENNCQYRPWNHLYDQTLNFMSNYGAKITD